MLVRSVMVSSTIAIGVVSICPFDTPIVLQEVGVEPSVGSTGDSYDNAMAESIIGLYKTEVIHARGPWRSLDAVEYATLEWVDWFNNRRLLEPIGYVSPVEFEQEYYRSNTGQALAA
jgi:putative transposase